MKYIVAALMAGWVVFAVPAVSYATTGTTHSGINVSGTVHRQSKKKKSSDYITVTAVCDGHTKRIRAHSDDSYKLHFAKSECKDDSYIDVYTTHNDGYGHSRHKSDGSGNCHQDINEHGPPTDVPEFGTIAMVAAGSISALSILMFRKQRI